MTDQISFDPNDKIQVDFEYHYETLTPGELALQKVLATIYDNIDRENADYQVWRKKVIRRITICLVFALVVYLAALAYLIWSVL